MRKVLSLLALLGVAALAGGCAAVSALPIASVLGSPNSASLELHNQTVVRLDQPNFVVVKTNLVGQTGGFALLGVLTIVPASFAKAANRLYSQAEMQSGHAQTLVNLVVEKNSTYYILFSLPKTTVRADLIEFRLPAATSSSPQLPAPTEPLPDGT